MIRALAPLTVAASALVLAAAPAAAAERPSGEETLAELLEGRVAGEPQDCINTFSNRPLKILDGAAIVYQSGDTVYVNRTRNPDSLDDDDIMVIRKFGSSNRLCRLDQITTRERTGGFYSGNIFLTEFVPYRKVGDS